MALTIPSQIFGTVAFALNTYAQPEHEKQKNFLWPFPVRLWEATFKI